MDGTWFPLLTALFAFFGIKEGVLDRILRTYPAQAMLVFILIGLAVTVGFIAPSLKVGTRVRLVAIVAGIASVGVFMWWRLPDLLPDETHDLRWVGWLLTAIAFVTLVVLTWNTFIPIVTAALIIGVAALGFGLYGAVKLSVDSKQTPEMPQLTAELKDGRVTVQATAGKLKETEFLSVGLVAISRSSRPFTRALLYPDSIGTIDKAVTFNLNNDRMGDISVRVRKCSNLPCSLNNKDERVFISLADDKANKLIGGVIDPGQAGQVTLTLKGDSVQRDSVLDISLEEEFAGQAAKVMTARILPTAEGSVDWSGTAAVRGAVGSKLRLSYAECRSAKACDLKEVLATYVYPPPNE